jgi:WD40 repeat protein
MPLLLTGLISLRDLLIPRFVFGMLNLGTHRREGVQFNGSTEKAVLMGHTSLVGQIQMRGNVLVTGGSDGSVRVWDLEKLRCVTRMAAHDNSVTSLQFDDKIIVTGGSDGYVKVPPLPVGQTDM